jgi:hypothetical protein
MKSRAFVLVSASLAALAAAAVTPAEAAAPNYQHYCAKRFPGSFVSRHNATGELLCTVRSTYSLMHYRLNYAEACNMQYGSPNFRRFGPGNVDCTGRTAAGPGRQRVLSFGDMNNYCARAFRNASANYSEPYGRWVCTVRTNNGLGLMHYTANLAQACQVNAGTFRFQQTGRTVTCFA